MKIVKLLLAISFALFFSLIGNVHAQITVQNESMSLGSKPSFVLDLDGANKKMAEKKWKEFIKEYGKVERNKKAKEQFVLQASLPGFSSPVDVTFKTDEGKDQTRAYFFFDNGSSFIEDGAEDADAVRVFLRDYQNLVDKQVAQNDLNDGEDVLKKFEKSLSKLEKKNKNLHNDIEKFKKKIAEAEANIQQNLKDQDAAKEEIEGQKNKVNELKDAYNNVGKG